MARPKSKRTPDTASYELFARHDVDEAATLIEKPIEAAKPPTKARGKLKPVGATKGTQLDVERIREEVELALLEGWRVVPLVVADPHTRKCCPVACLVRRDPVMFAPLSVIRHVAALLGVEERLVWDYEAGFNGRRADCGGGGGNMGPRDPDAYAAGAEMRRYLEGRNHER
jgi:hypothetical protein